MNGDGEQKMYATMNYLRYSVQLNELREDENQGKRKIIYDGRKKRKRMRRTHSKTAFIP